MNASRVVQVVRDCHSSLLVQKHSFWALQSMCSQISVVLILWLFDLIRKYYPICICINIYIYMCIIRSIPMTRPTIWLFRW